MPPRSTWKGQLKLSLVTIPIRLYNVVRSLDRISFNQLHKGCNRRTRYANKWPEHGELESSAIEKGYEYEKGKYVIVDDVDLEKSSLETTKTIELIHFVDRDELDSIYLHSPYCLAPDGAVARESFHIIREAMRQSNKIGIGRVVMHNKEQIVVIKPYELGLILTTVRCADEVRNATPYFEGIQEGDKPAEISEDQVKLAQRLVVSKTSPFDTSLFKDRNQSELLEIIKAKIDGTEPVLVQQEEVSNVYDFMDALKQSVEAAPEMKKVTKMPPAKSVKAASRRVKKKLA